MNKQIIATIIIIIFLIAAILNIIAYYSAAPIILFGIYAGLGLVSIRFIKGGDRQESVGFLIVFVICWFWAGISAIFFNYVGPSSQGPDVKYFFEVVVDDGMDPFEGGGILQNALSIYIWKIVYKFSSLLGFEKDIYVGVTFNMFLIASTALVGIKVVKTIFKNDSARINRFVFIYSSCGIFWLFGSIHLRDSMALFLITILLLFWVRYLVKSNFGNTIKLIMATTGGFLSLGLVRTEYIFVPAAFLLAGIAAKFIAGPKKLLTITLLICGLTIFIAAGGESFIFSLIAAIENSNRYDILSTEEGGKGSLSNALIINQVLPIKIIAGVIYLFLFPIPFWVGFQLESVYHLYKSFNVIYMYFIIPLLGVTIKKIITNKELRTTTFLFLAFCSIGFPMTVALTSLETRHFASFLVPILILALLPDLKFRTDLSLYRQYLKIFLLFIFILHLAWITVKLI